MKRYLLIGTIAAGMALYTTPMMGQFGQGQAGQVQTPGFNGSAGKKGNRNGPNDGTGNKGERPKDGSGRGAKSGKKGCDGNCDGQGPHGQSNRGSQSKGRRN